MAPCAYPVQQPLPFAVSLRGAAMYDNQNSYVDAADPADPADAADCSFNFNVVRIA